METLLVTYSIAGAAVIAYSAWLVIGNGRLHRRLERLDARNSEQPGDAISSQVVA